MLRSIRHPSFPAALIAVAALGLAGCNSFDPSYGDEPFRCGDSDPRCPDGYTCSAADDDEDGVCVRADDEPAPDAAGPDGVPPPACRVDLEEPNDARNQATTTGVPNGNPTFVMDDLTMCGPGDHDFFQFGLLADSRLRITVDSDSEALGVKVLLVNGMTAGTGTALNGNVTEFQAPGGNTPGPLSAGTYYLDVSSPTSSFSAYRIEIRTCPGSQPTCLD
jgi:hypothetical protein